MKYFEVYLENAVDATFLKWLYNGDSSSYNIGPDEEMHVVRFAGDYHEYQVRFMLSVLKLDYEDIITRNLN